MTPVFAGVFGIGWPEFILILVVIVALVIFSRMTRGNQVATRRICPKCGRSLSQPSDAPFCAYCGNRLP